MGVCFLPLFDLRPFKPLKVAINLSWQWCGVEQSRNIWLRHNYHKSPGGILVHFTSVVCVQDKWQGLSFNWILIPLSAVGILKVCNKRKVSSSLLWHVSSIFIFPSPPLNFKLVDVYLLKENKFWGKSFWNVQLHVFLVNYQVMIELFKVRWKCPKFNKDKWDHLSELFTFLFYIGVDWTVQCHCSHSTSIPCVQMSI